MGIAAVLWAGMKQLAKEALSRAMATPRGRDFVAKTARIIDNFMGGYNGERIDYITRAKDLDDRRREAAEGLARERDRRKREEHKQHLRDIAEEEKIILGNLEGEAIAEAAQKLEEYSGSMVEVPISADEISDVTGILSSKVCPSCNGRMGIRQGSYRTRDGVKYLPFYWQCGYGCPTIKFDPMAEHGSIFRPPDPNLDLARDERHRLWSSREFLLIAEKRLRDALGTTDDKICCINHGLPMMLRERKFANGRILAMFEYVCLRTDYRGGACQYRVPLETFPQFSAALKRREGYGIIH